VAKALRSQPNHGGGASAAQVIGVLFLLLFCFVIMSRKLPLGAAAIVCAWLAIIIGRVRVQVPRALRWYMLFVVSGTIGYLLAAMPGKDSQELIDAYKLVLVGIALCSLLTTKGLVRLFVVGYLMLYALFPVRGAFYNFFYGITSFGRISWNFYFANPNDLAIACLLPLGLCGFVIVTERGWLRFAAVAGVSVLLLIILLTQSRGVMLGLVGGSIYFLLASKNRLRLSLFLGAAVAIAAFWAPQSTWERFAGLTNASVHDMSAVDPEGSAESRWTIMGIGLKIAADHPVVGVGIGNYSVIHFRRTIDDASIVSSARGYRDAHSAYIRSAAEAGILGAIGITTFFVVSVLKVRRSRLHLASLPEAQLHALGLLALELSMIAYAIASIFGSVERTTFTLLQYLLPCLIAIVVAHDFREASSRTLIATSRHAVSRRQRRHVPSALRGAQIFHTDTSTENF
jgi:hypothetical protein